RETGTVKWFNRTKGFGFIVRENGEEIFVHHRSIRSDGQQRTSLRDGERVSFEVVKRSKGWQAEDVAAA
ncbi:MAG: cold shock domain-containing protein, partial [Gammaproteobacteria bacterium]|nr:cold shock domain-containing protein [Gammaproteobacteria bacterium]